MVAPTASLRNLEKNPVVVRTDELKPNFMLKYRVETKSGNT